MRLAPYAFGLAVAALVTVGAAAVPHAAPHHAVPVAQVARVALVADDTCLPAHPRGSGQGSGNLVATVPPLTLVRVDSTDTPTAVMTNTGRRPCAGDDFYALTAAGAKPASTSLVDRVLAMHFTGDWNRPGEWHPV